ncbi:hypothetical protein PANA5342_3908 [Pantoea ananatis LMG 5342]|nr:hypothetical protein PANA5342_3908 [Pantoea ananatis LMG 5342]
MRTGLVWRSTEDDNGVHRNDPVENNADSSTFPARLELQ